MESHLIVDGRNVVYQALYGLPPLSTTQGHQSGALYGFLQILRRIIITENPDFVAVCWDGKPLQRMKLLPEYKQQRDHSKSDLLGFDRQVEAAMEFLRLLGVPQMSHLELEADDIIAAYTFAVSNRYPSECKVTIVSADKDFWQLVHSKAVCCLNPRTDSKITYKNFKERTGFKSAADYLEYKIIVGDSSDNIPGLLKGVGDKRARAMVEEGNYAKNWSNGDADTRTIQRQYELIDFTRMIPKVKHQLESIFSGALVLDYMRNRAFNELCSYWEFHSMKHDEWVMPFITLYNKAGERKCFRLIRGKQFIHFKKALSRAIKNEKDA